MFNRALLWGSRGGCGPRQDEVRKRLLLHAHERQALEVLDAPGPAQADIYDVGIYGAICNLTLVNVCDLVMCVM